MAAPQMAIQGSGDPGLKEGRRAGRAGDLHRDASPILIGGERKAEEPAAMAFAIDHRPEASRGDDHEGANGKQPGQRSPFGNVQLF